MTGMRARMWEAEGRWHGRLEPDGRELKAVNREACAEALRAEAGTAALTIEVEPALLGVAEAAAVLGWDKRRIFTYLGRGSFPEPVATFASGRIWRRDDIEAFARTRRPRPVRAAVPEDADEGR